MLISPVGCSVFAYYYFDVGNVQVAHGRAPAVATAVKRSRPDSIVIGYQGDGDLAAIGTAEIIHAANRGEPITVIFVNNGIYGMTGGQMAPTTPLGKKTTTSPLGRDAMNEGYPLHVCEMLNSLEAPVFIERVALGNNKQIMHAAKVVKRAVENQVKGLGFSFVEVLSPCPTIWKMQPVEAQRFVQDEMAAIFGLCNLRDRTKEAQARPARAAAPALEDLPRLLDLVAPTAREPPAATAAGTRPADQGGGLRRAGRADARRGAGGGRPGGRLRSLVAAFVRAGDALRHVATATCGSPVTPSIRRWCRAQRAAGAERALAAQVPSRGGRGRHGALQRRAKSPADCVRRDVRMVALPFTQLADELGATKVSNIVMLGALLEATGMLEQDRVVGALKRLVNPRFFELDLAALARGRDDFARTTRTTISGEFDRLTSPESPADTSRARACVPGPRSC